MKTITISTETSETYSSISNFFIDYYMTDANGEFVKVYLYLIRLLSNNTAFTIAEIADHFNLTENDICRAIKYWISRDVLKLNYDGSGYPTGIVLLPLSRPDQGLKASSDALSILRKPNISTKEKPVPKVVKPIEDTAAADITERSSRIESSTPQKRELNADTMNDLIRNEDWEDLILTINTATGKPLSHTEIASLYYIHYDLGFDTNLVEYLVDYCYAKGKKKMSYIEAVARGWYEDGIRTKEDAKNHCSETLDLARKVLKALCITNRSMPSDPELEYIKTWHNDMKFSEELILKACDKAILSKPNSATFGYVHGIMETWHKNNVKSLQDVERLDQDFANSFANEKGKQKHAAGSKVSDFNSFAQSKGNSNSELAELQQLLQNQVNKQKRG